ncbi:MAG: hypothetical protein WCG44_03600 [bacterium]
MKNKILEGQIGLLLLVIMGVIIALVMSVASRSLSDTVLSRQERESSAAFSVAETGVEQAMSALQNTDGQSISGNLSAFSDAVTGNYQVNTNTTYGLFVKEGETAQLDVNSPISDFVIYWTKKSDMSENIDCTSPSALKYPAAIEISAVSTSGVVARNYYNAFNCSYGTTGFDASTIAGDPDYKSKVIYVIPDSTLKLRIKPLLAGATIAVSGTGLSNQLYLIQSKAATGDAQKEIEVKRGLDAPPSVFDFSLFTTGTIGN